MCQKVKRKSAWPNKHGSLGLGYLLMYQCVNEAIDNKMVIAYASIFFPKAMFIWVTSYLCLLWPINWYWAHYQRNGSRSSTLGFFSNPYWLSNSGRNSAIYHSSVHLSVTSVLWHQPRQYSFWITPASIHWAPRVCLANIVYQPRCPPLSCSPLADSSGLRKPSLFKLHGSLQCTVFR